MLKSAAVVFSCLLCCMLLVAAISSVVVFLYHHYYLRPHEMIVVDFRALSEAKLSQMVEDSRNGHPASATDIKKFIGQLHQVITEEAGSARCISREPFSIRVQTSPHEWPPV